MCSWARARTWDYGETISPTSWWARFSRSFPSLLWLSFHVCPTSPPRGSALAAFLWEEALWFSQKSYGKPWSASTPSGSCLSLGVPGLASFCAWGRGQELGGLGAWWEGLSVTTRSERLVWRLWAVRPWKLEAQWALCTLESTHWSQGWSQMKQGSRHLQHPDLHVAYENAGANVSAQIPKSDSQGWDHESCIWVSVAEWYWATCLKLCQVNAGSNLQRTCHTKVTEGACARLRSWKMAFEISR